MTLDPKHPETKFKSAYYLQDKLLSFFLNYNKGNESFTFIIKKGAYATIYNLTSEEKIPVIRSMLRELSKEELNSLFRAIEIEKEL